MNEIINDNVDLFKKSESDIQLNQYIINLLDSIINILRTILYEYFGNLENSLVEEELNTRINKPCISEEIEEEDQDFGISPEMREVQKQN